VSENIRTLTEEIANQNETVPLFKRTDDAFQIASMITEEAQELVDELEVASVTDDLTQVAGEVADVLYLALKMCHTLGFNADEVLVMKIKRNEEKYGGHHCRKTAKEEWSDNGGDVLFYQMYLMMQE
jgi:NTP pyrophosphatase (non-canonical NTP hydrolase)